ncbi:DUF2202 domain-containing protein [Oscillochloris sp. ZM17-4]|uniref:ferritin-like domain-containing protein n=1 Tax=Oscillochloris sp. ZM17-4 TaxID=2866714 RepID=UPI001C737D2C|nr:DUF2202 domain-containing protein [Oscillochloris sp. ZM17-4]MBX0329832.1 DUF2202 domain-containing protein [Oscillochloris sp. ZM17-4]
MRRAIIISSLALGLALSACAAPASTTTSAAPVAPVAAASQQSAPAGAGMGQGTQGQGTQSQGTQGNTNQSAQGQGTQGQGTQGNTNQSAQGQGTQGQGTQGNTNQSAQGQGTQGQGTQGQGNQGQGNQGQGNQGQGNQGQGNQGQGGPPTAPVVIAPSNLPETPCLICETDMSQYSGPLSADEINGLLLALNDEYHAWAVYDQVISDFGDVRPFASIIESEAGHISSLETLFNVYGLPLPAENPWVGQAPSFTSVSEACAAGVDAEIVNADLYTRLFVSTDRADIVRVYEQLQAASLDKHLTAFQRCS